MPALIAIFAVGAYGFGSALRGSDVIVNEVAIVRGAPDATEGTAQVYLGVFSPTRGTYQVSLPGRRAAVGADRRRLLRRPGRGASTSSRAIPPRVRDLAVGFGSLRTSGPSPRPSSRRSTPISRSSTASSTGTIRNDSDDDRSRRRRSSSAATSWSSRTSPRARTAGRSADHLRTSSARRSRTRSSARSSSTTAPSATRRSAATRPATGSSTS